jgi:hypothetical protein
VNPVETAACARASKKQHAHEITRSVAPCTISHLHPLVPQGPDLPTTNLFSRQPQTNKHKHGEAAAFVSPVRCMPGQTANGLLRQVCGEPRALAKPLHDCL